MELPGYEITRCIGQGGMATAYLAKQTSLDRLVVLKVLDTSVNDTPHVVERFLNEGRIVASLHHPNIITIYDINRCGNDVYIAMEYVEGGDLKERLEHQSFAPAEALDIVTKIANGLAVAHKNGIVHRDVKPGNILFRSDGTPLLSDFGIAKQLEGDGDLTATGTFVGSPNYMAPEQADAGAIDGRADIYALGAILYEMLTGLKPYFSESVIDVILMHKMDPVPTLPVGLEQYQPLLNLMMAKDPKDRFRDAESLLQYLNRLTAVTATVNDETDEGVTLDPAAQPFIESGSSVTRVKLRAPRRLDRRSLLLVVLVIVGLANLGLAYLSSELDRAAVPQQIPTVSPDALVLPPPSDPASITSADEQPQSQQVVDALLWLGRHSLNEFRLVEPARDNAYYYFQRLLQIDPTNAGGQQGLRDLAERYALLADRAIADGNNAAARGYIAIGLQIDPNNDALKSLDRLALPDRKGFFATIRRLFE